MKIPSAKYLKNKARIRLASGQKPKEVILVYSALSAGIAFTVTAVQYFLNSQISQTGGLKNIGTRSILSTIANVLPMLQTVFLLCLSLGYLSAMLRIGRHQYASAKTLKAGVERFWPLLGSKLILAAMYIGIALGLSILSTQIFIMTPLSHSFNELAAPILSSGTFTPDILLNDPILTDQFFVSMFPMMILYALLLIPICVLVSYNYRMTDYVLIDQPGKGAMYALRQSRILMRGNLFRLFKLDLSFWWYYLLRFLATGLLYLDVILALFYVFLPFSDIVVFFGTTLLYLTADFAINYFFKNRCETAYALAYDSLIPKENSNGVVLGNIFDLNNQ